MSNNINLPLSGMNPVAVATLSRNVVTKLTGNANFPDPAVNLEGLTTKTAALEAAIDKATFGSQTSKIERNDLSDEVKALLKIQGNYVRTASAGSRSKLSTSGFELSKIPEKKGIPGAPVIKEVKMTGLTGQVELKWNKDKNASVYQVWMTDTDPSINANWNAVAISSKVTATIDNLESYKAYWFCISAIGSAGEGAKGDVTIGRAA